MRSPAQHAVNDDRVATSRKSGSGESVAEVARYIAAALVNHVRRQSEMGRQVPREVIGIARFLAQVVSNRLDTTTGESTDAVTCRQDHDAPVTEQLLVTKEEAAKRLSVSVRTVERLAAAGRLPQVHIDRAVRFRVRDLHAYVDELPTDVPDPGTGQPT